MSGKAGRGKKDSTGMNIHSFGGSGAFVCGFAAFEAFGAIVDRRWGVLGRTALRPENGQPRVTTISKA